MNGKSRRVCLVTRHAIVNYGSYLQTFATVKLIEQLGYEVIVLDYVRKDEDYRNVTDLLLLQSDKWNKNTIRRLIYKIVHVPDHYLSGRAFEKIRNKTLCLSKRISDIDEQKNLIPNVDVYCTGSDQVWGEIGNESYDPVYFLSFVDNPYAKRVAISASFGKITYSTERMDEINEYLKKYTKISVREKSTIDLFESMEIEANLTLDPTMIVSNEFWNQYLKKQTSTKKYILLYQLNTNSEMDKYAQKLSNRLGMKLIRISMELYKMSKPGKFKLCLSPFEFLSYVKYAEYVITDSFHGTAFAICFNTQFIEILPPEKQTRNKGILKQLGLENRIVENLKSFDLVDNPIDYSSVNDKLRVLRDGSIEVMKEIFKVES
ncbi:MAG: polysaccharide pyruvyl transferase family protein [Bacilli bacterium]|uniref:polysaccharide pyruvyl transferase family protein n=1 Tax=Anaerorhabdus sp. TaxID=1872524 RepID=UPI002FC69C16